MWGITFYQVFKICLNIKSVENKILSINSLLSSLEQKLPTATEEEILEISDELTSYMLSDIKIYRYLTSGQMQIDEKSTQDILDGLCKK